MGEWHDLFVATAGAAAALAGLLFVGVSINLNRILSFARLPGRALISLVFLSAILILSVLLLIPAQPLRAAGIEVLVFGLATWLILIRTDISIYRHTDKPYKRVYFGQMVMNQLAVLPYLAGGIMLCMENEAGLYAIVFGFLFSFIKAILDAWVLLVEINR